MKTSANSTGRETRSFPVKAEAPVHRSPVTASGPRRAAQLASIANSSPRVQVQLKLAQDIQESEPVEKLLSLSGEVNGRQASTAAGAQANELASGESHENCEPKSPESKGSSTGELGPGSPPVQRRVVPYDTRYVGPLRETHRAAVGRVMDDLNGRVTTAYEQALRWQTLAQNVDAFVSQWHTSAQAYAANPDTEPSLVHARFGYAVESLACQGLNNTQLHGLTISTQVAHGHTRPDIVLSAGQTEVAWLDITSEASIGHILGKDSSGWGRRPFVSEIVYPQLQLRTLLNATDDPYYQEYGALLAGERQIELDVKDARRTALRDRLIRLRDENDWTTGTGNAGEKRRRTRDAFMGEAADEGVEEDRESMANTRGALENLGINSGPYGFNRGDVRSRSERLTQVIDEGSRETIETRKTQLGSATTQRIIQELRASTLRRALVDGLEEEFFADPGNRPTALAAMALKGAVQDLNGLDGSLNRIRTTMDGRIARVAQLEADVRGQLTGPAAADHDTVLAWRRRAHELGRRTGALSNVLQASDALHRYEVDRGINLFTRPPNVARFFQQLSEVPPNAAVATAAMEWIRAQPPPPQAAVGPPLGMGPQPVVLPPLAMGPQPVVGAHADGGVEPMDTSDGN